MNIKDIAKLAEVSTSTVSKVINGKDENISSSTRERILSIVKQYNYTPYEAVLSKRPEKSFVLGILTDVSSNQNELLISVLKAARDHGYGMIVCPSATPEEEFKNILRLAKHQVDGILWERLEKSYPKSEQKILAYNVPIHLMDSNLLVSEENSCIDYFTLAYQATEKLLEKHHESIVFLQHDGNKGNRLMAKGFAQCLRKHNIAYSDNMCQNIQDVSDHMERILFQYTAAVCSNLDVARLVSDECVKHNRMIPQHFSLISLHEGQGPVPKLSSLEIPFGQLGIFACERLISLVENPNADYIQFRPDIQYSDQGSIGLPITQQHKKIVIVGAINMDVILNMDGFPKLGETAIADHRVMIPGGKGVNQAIGVAKLGAIACLIGKTGEDIEGSTIFDCLHQNGVNTEDILSTSKAPTGSAYIYVQQDGESGIVVHKGANSMLEPEDIVNCQKAFINASYCLVQTELDERIVYQTVSLAREHNVSVLLKPAAAKHLNMELLKYVDVFLPNEHEAQDLCPQLDSLEEKAEYFLQQGAGTVIITLGNKGCYLNDGKISKYFPAANFKVVDTTGAADAFASTLAVYLSQNFMIETSIQYATCAAGYSVTKQGVPPALIDKYTLDYYMQKEYRVKGGGNDA